MFSDWWKMISDSSANGSVSGSDSRIVTGCSHDSNCAARIRYMKMNDSAIAVRNALAVRFNSRERPAKSARYSGGIQFAAAASISLLRRALRRARQHVRGERHLPLPAHPADRRRRIARGERRDVVERHDAEARGRHWQRRDRLLRVRDPVLGAQVHLVLLAALVVSRHLVAADEQPQRLSRIGDLHAEIGRLRPVELHRHLWLAGIQGGVDVNEAGNPLDLGSQRLAVFLECPRSGPWSRNWMSPPPPPGPPVSARGRMTFS